MNHQDRGRSARRVLALLGTAALVLTGAVSAGTAAYAVDSAPPPPGNITGTEGTLHIHKHAGNPTGPGNGQEISDSDLGIGVDGITFTIERVTGGMPSAPIDLTTTDGWNLAKQASDGFVPATGALPAGFGVVPAEIPSVTTSGGGQASAPLPYGLYRVTEQPNATVDAPAQPFLVTLPYPSDGAWLYNVHVYPKNLLKDDPSKTVSTPVDTEGLPAVVEGSLVTWTITAPVPRAGEAGNTFTSFLITDALDERLKYTSAVVKLDGVELTEGDGGDYTLSHTGADPVTGQGGTVTIALNDGILEGLQTGQIVTVELTTEVHGVGEITNTAIRNVNDNLTTIGTPQTNWGKIKVVKQNANGAKLEGAKFELWTDTDPRTLVYPEQSPSDANGEILFDAVWLGNGMDKSERYCLKETQAPPGYVTPTGEAAFTCIEVSTADGEGTAIHTVPVTNTQQDGPTLPLTGSAGTAMFMAGGLALLLIAGGAALVASRRRASTLDK